MHQVRLVKVATLAGRDQLCINEKVMKEKSTEIKAHMCRSLVNGRKCHYYNMLDSPCPSIYTAIKIGRVFFHPCRNKG